MGRIIGKISRIPHVIRFPGPVHTFDQLLCIPGIQVKMIDAVFVFIFTGCINMDLQQPFMAGSGLVKSTKQLSPNRSFCFHLISP